ncbi:MAG: right-handed parallel beta-helix repeat-containing protein [Patescibacteria group bacterium]
MPKLKKLIIFSIIFFGVFGLAGRLRATTYYVAPFPVGNDTNSGISLFPWATFTKAFSMMSAGDTLYLKDGVYNQQMTGIPSGTAGNYTKIYALNDHMAEIDGQGTIPSLGWQGLLYISGKSYIEIRGLKIHGSSYSNSVCLIENSNHITLRVTGCWEAGAYKHDLPVTISGITTNNILLEDVWAFGKGRYAVMVFQAGDNVVLRRVVTRFDSGSYAGEPNAGVSIYSTSNAIVENNITLDHNGQNIQGDHNGFYLPNNNYPSNNNKFYGNIALNLPKAITDIQIGANGFGTDGPSSKNNIFINNVAVNTQNGIIIGGSGPDNSLIQNNTFFGNYNHGVWNGGAATATTLKNTLLDNNAGYGGYSGGEVTATYNGTYQNTLGAYSGMTCGTGCITTSPHLLYLTRIEMTSPYKGAGESGADIGANVVKRYQDGVLTATDLWPWPYESWIKQDMCTTVGVTRGFCSSSSLTNYAWNYLGNGNPYSSSDTTPPAAPTGLSVS